MKWTEVKVKTRPENEDIISHILYEEGAAGLAIEDPDDIEKMLKKKKDWDFVDSSLIDVEKGIIFIKAYFPDSDELINTIQRIRENIEVKPKTLGEDSYGKVVLKEVNDEDWAESWKKYYKPTKIGESIVIKPTWEEYDLREDEVMVELDPGMAFGTGTHETTYLCIETLEKFVKEGFNIYDIGCGSGILSIVAAKLGAEKVVGVDLDPVCIDVSKKNIDLNGVEDRVRVVEGNLLDVVDEKVDLIVSNIIAEIIVTMTKDLKRFLKKDGIFIASGIILDKESLVLDSLRENGFEVLEVNRKNEWLSIVSRY